MWTRATWHECADELDEVCHRFGQAYWGKRSKSWPRHPDDEAEMKESSREGVTLLRALASAVRSEQDFKLAPHSTAVVGVLKNENALPTDAIHVKHRGGYERMLGAEGYVPLKLREALDKILHADPQTADYYIGGYPGVVRNHDLLLYGEFRGKKWFAAVSIPDLIKAIRSLPDASVVTKSEHDVRSDS